MKKATISVVLGLFLFTPISSWAACPDSTWINSSSVPSCPSSDNTILSANYPNAAYVVSATPASHRGGSNEFTSKTVLEILKNSGESVPMILIPTTDSDAIDKVKTDLKQFVQSNPQYAAKQEQWLSAISQVQSGGYTWQQDYFESFYDPTTGHPILRNIDAYFRSGFESRTANLQSTANMACPGIVRQGDGLKKLGDTQNVSAYSGGNIDALPGGLCLHGDNQPRQFAAQYCGSPSNETVIKSSWLSVGHVDEISGTVHSPNAKSPCDFAITLASPKLALDLLKAAPNDPFFSFKADGANATQDLSYRAAEGALSSLCFKAAQFSKRLPNSTPRGTDPPSPSGPATAAPAAMLERTLRRVLNVIEIPNAVSGIIVGGAADPSCSQLTNAQVLQALQGNSDLGILNQLVQKSMDEAKATIKAKIKSRLPQCEVNFIELPQLFSGGAPVEKTGRSPSDPIEKRYELPDHSLKSILPNSTNALVVGNAVLSPYPQNEAFAKYMDQAFSKQGIKNVFVDTYDYAHVADGNIHCSTHSLPVCRPAERK